eukprot:5740531-Pleurochrysis_carterae.AAC.2
MIWGLAHRAKYRMCTRVHSYKCHAKLFKQASTPTFIVSSASRQCDCPGLVVIDINEAAPRKFVWGRPLYESLLLGCRKLFVPTLGLKRKVVGALSGHGVRVDCALARAARQLGLWLNIEGAVARVVAAARDRGGFAHRNLALITARRGGDVTDRESDATVDAEIGA